MHAYIGEGNGKPLQYSCLENPVDRGAWWAAVHQVAQSQTRLKRLSMHVCVGEGHGGEGHKKDVHNLSALRTDLPVRIMLRQ